LPTSGDRPPPRPREPVLKPLVDAARRGDRDAFDQLVRLTWASTYTLAYRLTANAEDALDVTQESYLRALKGLPRFRGEARFSTWMYRVTANCANSHLARAGRDRHDELDPDNVDPRRARDGRLEHDPEAVVVAGDDRELLTEALGRLPLRLRQVVVLRDVYDLSHKAIAAELGTSEAAAKVGLQRARKRLREDLGGQRVGDLGPGHNRRAVLRRRPKRPDGTPVGSGPVVERDDNDLAS
jgi:RNA polymerase sigma-70 factor, ECF subfamily